MWETGNVLRQIEGIGKKYAELLTKAKITSFKELETAKPFELESICGRKAPFGMQIKQSLTQFPSYEINLKVFLDLHSETANMLINSLIFSQKW